MATAQTTWQRVDEPVLRWVAALPSVMEVDFVTLEHSDESALQVSGLTQEDVNRSLRRLHSYGLIGGQEQPDGPAGSIWSNLRVAADGLIVLGEWPDIDQVASAATLQRLLIELSNAAPKESQTALKRAAGSVGRTLDSTIKDTLSELAEKIGDEAV